LSKPGLLEGARELRKIWGGFRAARVFITAHKAPTFGNPTATRTGPLSMINGK